MNANEYQRYAIIRYRLLKPKHSTWSELLDVSLALRLRTVHQLKLQIEMMLQDKATSDDIRKHLQVSHRHTLSRREVFNYIVKLHNENQWASNWRLIIHALPLPTSMFVRIECGAVTCDWFRHQCKQDYLKIKAEHVSHDQLKGDVIYDTIDGYTLSVIDDLEEYAQLCV